MSDFAGGAGGACWWGAQLAKKIENRISPVAPRILQLSSRFFLNQLRASKSDATELEWDQSVAWLIFGGIVYHGTT